MFFCGQYSQEFGIHTVGDTKEVHVESPVGILYGDSVGLKSTFDEGPWFFGS